ncbi:hypothetical protein TWF225_009169 [Orbilia oligospora]|nr:hypothetical protein TWF751_003771 [Orbilia oligospora]KAF3193597.1 hypothetical protein TWF225_009169 [Orbilia oligospora]KAF3239939.1 hypothetical protein TWF128_011435 [Orbilia oligospora]KAF3265849.1 hypothetical protein TWF217_002375 [Orbilia oligospora]KAF3276770.1 hypothetical protein TWF132_001894 [Orbilia oligospora]
MGYTHYWRGLISSKTSHLLLKDITHLLTTTTIKIRGPLGTGQPLITPQSISLNGEAEDQDSHESLRIPINEAIPFQFCKTARKPYDDVVCAVLLRCLYYNPYPAFEVSSDGSWEEWTAGRELYRKAFEAEATMPETMTPSWN